MQQPTETSPSPSTSENLKRRRRFREDSSVKWFKLGKTKLVKEYRPNELDDFHTMEGLEQQTQHERIETVADFEFEVQEQGEMQEITTYRAKRIRWPENENSSENLNCSLGAELNSSKSTKCDSSASNLEESDSDQVSEPSGVVKRKMSKLKTNNDQQSFNEKTADQNIGMNERTGEYLDLKVDKLPRSAFAGNCSEVNSSYLNPVFYMETALVDVHLTVKASHRAENVPFVCLTSNLHGKAILGYPLEVGEIRDELFDDKRSRFHRLVWRTSKRTPVCYVTNSLSSSVSKNVWAGQASENVEDSMLPARDNGVRIKEKYLTKLLNDPKQFNQGELEMSRSCVPVELIFSKLIAAVRQVQS